MTKRTKQVQQRQMIGREGRKRKREAQHLIPFEPVQDLGKREQVSDSRSPLVYTGRKALEAQHTTGIVETKL